MMMMIMMMIHIFEGMHHIRIQHTDTLRTLKCGFLMNGNRYKSRELGKYSYWSKIKYKVYPVDSTELHLR